MSDKSTACIEGVLFDLDGTLVDTHDIILESMRYATYSVLGKDIPQDILLAKVGQPLAVQMRDFADSDQETEELLSVYRTYNAKIHDKGIRSFPGTEETLHRLLDQGYKLGVVTSKRHELALHGLRMFGLSDYFSCLVGSDDWDTYKPDPGPVIHGADLLGIKPRKCAYVGDSPYDIRAGNTAGCFTIAALWGMFPKQILAKEGPDYFLEGIHDLVELGTFCP